MRNNRSTGFPPIRIEPMRARNNQTGNIILFDGICNLCNGFVQYVIRRDQRNVFRFGSLQSERARELLRPLGSPGTDLSTIVLLDGHEAVTESDAVLRIVGRLGGAWKLVSWFRIIPKPIRDGVYRLISRYRYAIFGRRDSCMVPTPELEDKFI